MRSVNRLQGVTIRLANEAYGTRAIPWHTGGVRNEVGMCGGQSWAKTRTQHMSHHGNELVQLRISH